MNDKSDFCIFYMCEPGRLEWQAMCLASSLMALCTDRYKLVAYCSSHKISSLKDETIEFHKRHDIAILPIDTEGVFVRKYLVGGKIVAASQKRDGPFSVLMDTDTVLVSNTSFADIRKNNSVSVFPSNTKMLSYTPENWRYAYGKFGLAPPKRRFKFDYPAPSSPELEYPYFNAGLIVFPEISSGLTFGETWLEITKAMQLDGNIPNQMPWLDQISLPVAIERLELATVPIERTYNFPVEEKGKAIRPDVKIIHYHFGGNLQFCSSARLVRDLIVEFTPFSDFEDMFKAYANAGFSDHD